LKSRLLDENSRI